MQAKTIRLISIGALVISGLVSARYTFHKIGPCTPELEHYLNSKIKEGA